MTRLAALPLGKASEALPESGHAACDGLKLSWEPLGVTVQRPRRQDVRVTPDESMSLQVSRTQTPRKLLGLLPWGTQDWLQIELRTPREVLIDVRAPVEPTLVEGLPWSGDDRAAVIDERAAIALVGTSMRAGASLAAWPEADTIAPDKRVHPEHTTEDPKPEPKPDPEATARRWQLVRHVLASLAASAGLGLWFYPDAPWAPWLVAPAAMVFIGVCSIGPPQTALMIVYGSVGVVGWPFLREAIEPSSGGLSAVVGLLSWCLALIAANIMVHKIRPDPKKERPGKKGRRRRKR